MVLTKVYRDNHGEHTTNTKQDNQHPDTTDDTRSKPRNKAPLVLVIVFFVCLCVVCLCLFVFVCCFVALFCVSKLCFAIIRGFKGVVVDVHGHNDGANPSVSG